MAHFIKESIQELLENYFQLEGLAYRITPIKHDNKGGTGWINVDRMYDNLVNNFGCLGGKLIGAGGGGFLLMVVKNKKKTKKLLKRKGYLFLEFVIIKEGSKII